MHKLLEVAMDAARAGAAEALAVRRREDFEVRLKEDRTPVTEADERSVLAVANVLKYGSG